MRRRTAIGYAVALSGAAFAALNGSLGRFLLDDGMSAWELTQMRSVLTAAILAAALALVRPRLLRLPRGRLGALAQAALAMTIAQAAYFYAVSRVQIAVALVFVSCYPLLIFAWLALRHRRRLHPALWACGAAAIAGGFLVVDGPSAGAADALGIVAALVSAAAFAVYLVAAERLGDDCDPATVTLWSFALAAVVWLVVLPPWGFPFDVLAVDGNALVALGVVVVGTLLVFGAIVVSVRFVPATRASVLFTSEAAWGALFAFLIHDERLSALQICGAGVVIAAVVVVQVLQPAAREEAAPRAVPA